MQCNHHLAELTIRIDFKHMKTEFDCKFGDPPKFRAFFTFYFFLTLGNYGDPPCGEEKLGEGG